MCLFSWRILGILSEFICGIVNNQVWSTFWTYFRRTNPVETIYAAFPAILYLSPAWAKYLLKPLLQFESSSLYSENFAAGDLGSYFPAAVGNGSPLPFSALEYTSDMLIMAWAHARFSGDGSLLSSYVRLLFEPDNLVNYEWNTLIFSFPREQYPTLKKWSDWLLLQLPLTPADS